MSSSFKLLILKCLESEQGARCQWGPGMEHEIRQDSEFSSLSDSESDSEPHDVCEKKVLLEVESDLLLSPGFNLVSL